MLKETISRKEAIEYLNSILWADPEAINQLFLANRVQCNETLAGHESAQVGFDDGKYLIGTLGVINGLFGVDEKGMGAIAALCYEGKISGFISTEFIHDRPSTPDGNGGTTPANDTP